MKYTNSRYGTAGLLSPNTEAKIVDPESGEALPVNRTGELWITGPYVMKGKTLNYRMRIIVFHF
jgi:OPC-8:0 CoA ligase 1